MLLLRSGIAQQLSDFKDYEERAKWDVEALRQICLYLSGNQGVSAATYSCFQSLLRPTNICMNFGPTSHPAHISRDDIVSALAKKERHLAAVIAARDALRKALSDRTVLHEVEGFCLLLKPHQADDVMVERVETSKPSALMST